MGLREKTREAFLGVWADEVKTHFRFQPADHLTDRTDTETTICSVNGPTDSNIWALVNKEYNIS